MQNLFTSLSLTLFHIEWLVKDTPGLVDEDDVALVIDKIRAELDKRVEREQDPARTKPLNYCEDTRFDACIYFLEPNCGVLDDIDIIVELSKLVPVISVIARVMPLPPSASCQGFPVYGLGSGLSSLTPTLRCRKTRNTHLIDPIEQTISPPLCQYPLVIL
jgi:hypothetical protein